MKRFTLVEWLIIIGFAVLVITFSRLIYLNITTPDNAGAQIYTGPVITGGWVYEEGNYPPLPYTVIMTFYDDLHDYDQVCLYRLARRYYDHTGQLATLPKEVFIGCSSVDNNAAFDFIRWGGPNTDTEYTPKPYDQYRLDFKGPHPYSTIFSLGPRYGYYSILNVIVKP